MDMYDGIYVGLNVLMSYSNVVDSMPLSIITLELMEPILSQVFKFNKIFFTCFINSTYCVITRDFQVTLANGYRSLCICIV